MPTNCACQNCCSQWSWPCSRPLSNHSSAGDSHTLTGKLAQSFVGSLLLSPESWCTQGFSVSSKSLFPPVLWKFYNQIPLTFKSGDSQSLCQSPRLRSLMCILEPSQQCENFFDIIVLQFLGHPSGGSMVGLMVTSSKNTYANTPCFPRLMLPVPLSAGHCWPASTQEALKHSRVGLAQSLVRGHCNFPQGPGAHKVLFVPSKSLWQVWGLISTRLHPSYHLVAASPLFLDMRYLVLVVGFSILLSMVVQQLVMILVFFQEKMRACSSTPPSCLKLFTLILFKNCWCISITYQIKFKVLNLASHPSTMHSLI